MYTLPETQALPAALVGTESQLLARHADLAAPAFVIPSTFEEAFYRHNNLPAQLAALFARIQPARIDEDALEPLCGQARALLLGAALLDDSVQTLYRALRNAGLDQGPLHLRRPGHAATQAALARPPGTEVLHALKRLWADDWSFGAVLARLDDTGTVGLDASPALVLRGPPGQADAALALQLGCRAALRNAYGLTGLTA
ncbi:hypothetical protein [Deinococcus aquiradiocola]|uniref:Uncharacterized protein n=1 Tax=Deinococcus aquiradiocola TaxID=393059 RepID=A0A917P3D2_9DEIO|nr:hypothetical protein [Deinococcus aquiradiocola]GGJ60262.1 hypothetical protein GCM10008939_00010 [Deinococcus aquiradiocola]